MLTNAAVMPTIPAVDLDRARGFYERTLGLTPAGPATPDGIMYRCGSGTRLFLYPRTMPARADHTVASFVVEDIGAVVNALRTRGVVFEDYDFPGLKTINGIATLATEKAAWFKDPEGNILAVSQFL
jgi:catechol 2,3-dioxygenase-like lactoylglutathione lyase family enzyme